MNDIGPTVVGRVATCSAAMAKTAAAVKHPATSSAPSLRAAAVAAALAMRKSLASQQAERDLWAEATDDVR